MAIGPSIIQSAARGDLPSAQFNPRSASAADMGGQVGAAIADLGQGVANVGQRIEQFEAAKLADQKRLRDFTLETNLVRFQSEEAARLAQEQQEITDGGWEFQKNFALTHAANAEQWLVDNGVEDPDQRARWAVPLQRLYGSLSGEALGVEFKERDRFYTADTNEALDLLRTAVDQRPELYDEYQARGFDIIERSGLSRSAKDAAATQWNRQSQYSLGVAIGKRDGGEALLDALGEKFEGGGAAGAASDVSLAFDVLLVAEDGLGPNGEPLTSSAGARGVAQVMEGTGPEAARLAGLEWDRDKWANDTAYNRALGEAYFAEQVKTFDGDVRKGWAAYNAGPRWVSAAVERAAAAAPGTEQADWFWQLNNDGRTAANKRQTREYVEKNDALYAQRGGATTAAEPRQAGPIDPRLDGLGYDDRQRLTEFAQRSVQAEQQAVAQRVQAEADNRINTLELALLDDTAGQAEIDALRQDGTLRDASDVNRLQNILETKAEEATDLDLYNTLVGTPGAVFNQFDGDQRKAVDAAYKSGVPIDAIFRRTGMVPPSAVSSIRGSLLSPDPEVVTGTANLASNIMKRNPNAFSGYEGGEDIAQAGLQFDYYVDILGYTAERAGQEIARNNDPERANAIRPDAARVTTFRTEMAEVPVSRVIGAIPGARASDVPRPQQLAVQADFLEIAANNFRQTGDARMSQSMARQQIERLWGVARNGTITKFPPEKIYPADNGSHDYIYRQAAAIIRERVEEPEGFDEENIFLMPAPGITAEAWRQGQPPRYQIGYRFEVDGQQVVDVLPNAYRFFPPPAATRPARENDNQERFDRLRAQRLGPQNPGQNLPGRLGTQVPLR